MILDVVEKYGPVQLTDAGRDAMLVELVHEHQRDAFPYRISSVDFDFKTQGNSGAVDHLVKQAVAIGVFPAGFIEQGERFCGIERITH